MADGELMTTKEVCDTFGVAKSTVYKWGETGTLTKIKVGGIVRYRRDEINVLLRRERVEEAS